MNGQNTNLDLRGIGTYVSASTSTVGDNSPIAMKVDQENTANVQNGSAVKEPAETLALEKEAKDFEEEFTDITSQSKKNRIWPMVEKCAIFILGLIIFYVFYFYFADFKEDLDYVKD